MRSIKLALLIVLALAASAAGQTERTVNSVVIKPGLTSNVAGNLNEGSKLPDLSFAWNSSIACFPATQQAKFTGNHVFYTVDMPSRSIITVSVEPTKKGTDLSIYGYQIGSGKHTLPDSLGSVVTCEAEHKWDYPKKGRIQTDARSITFNSTTNAYSLMLAVAGPNGATSGDYRLKISLKQ
ncbi:MAG: hypothetical protein ABL999_09410 [Pyrinomonadaceae bacterium]